MKHTALFHKHEQVGASLIEHYGWQVPAYFTFAQKEATGVCNSVGIADVSWMSKFDLKGRGLETLPALGEHVRSWSLGPQHVLVTCSRPAARESMVALPPSVSLTDVTSAYTQFLLAGPRSRDVLRKLTSLNVSERALPDLGCGQTSLAHVHAMILRQDLGKVLAFPILVSREYSESVWEAIVDAGQEFHIVSFGLLAQEMLSN